MSSEGNITVPVTRRFLASPPQVYDAWLDAANVGRWLFATPEGQMVQIDIHPHIGGCYVITERRNGEDVAHAGTYLELDRPHRLVFTLNVEKYSDALDRISIDLRPRGNGCELTLSHTMSAAHAGIQTKVEEGWSTVLEGLAKTLGE